MPRKLYKYRTFSENNLDALQRGVLFLGSPAYFNDPYDNAIRINGNRFRINMDDMKEFLSRQPSERASRVLHDISNINGDLNREDLLERILENLQGCSKSDVDKIKSVLRSVVERYDDERSEKQSRFLRRGMKVTCLSERPRSITMWSHYAAQHTGFCIEYDFYQISASHPIRRSCLPVFYRNKMTDFTRFIEKDSNKNLNPMHGMFASLIKHEEWSYEKEWRIVFPSGTDEPFPIEMPLPKSVTVGAFASDENLQRMIDFGNERGAPIYQLKQRRDAYRLEPVPINGLAK